MSHIPPFRTRRTPHIAPPVAPPSAVQDAPIEGVTWAAEADVAVKDTSVPLRPLAAQGATIPTAKNPAVAARAPASVPLAPSPSAASRIPASSPDNDFDDDIPVLRQLIEPPAIDTDTPNGQAHEADEAADVEGQLNQADELSSALAPDEQLVERMTDEILDALQPALQTIVMAAVRKALHESMQKS